MGFFSAYRRAKLWGSFFIVLVVAGCIANIELRRAMHFDRALASTATVEQLCYASGGRREVSCDAAPPAANRITYLHLYWQTAGGDAHDGWARCVTEREKTRTYLPGQQVEILVDQRDPANFELPKCSKVGGPYRRMRG